MSIGSQKSMIQGGILCTSQCFFRKKHFLVKFSIVAVDKVTKDFPFMDDIQGNKDGKTLSDPSLCVSGDRVIRPDLMGGIG
jgi:hypothetical protein